MRTTDTALPSTLAARPVVSGPVSTRRVSAALAILAKTMTAVWRFLNNRRTTAYLQDLDDRQLADIGLTRNDVQRAVNATFSEDSARYLMQVSQDRARSFYRDPMRH